MSTHKIQIPIVVLTGRGKELFLRWALEGFRTQKRGTQHEATAALARENKKIALSGLRLVTASGLFG